MVEPVTITLVVTHATLKALTGAVSQAIVRADIETVRASKEGTTDWKEHRNNLRSVQEQLVNQLRRLGV